MTSQVSAMALFIISVLLKLTWTITLFLLAVGKQILYLSPVCLSMGALFTLVYAQVMS